MKALVTGAAGFIGSHVVDALRGAGADLIGLDSLDPGVHHRPPGYLRGDVDYCFADLRQWRPDDRVDDVELIVHLAALGGVARAAREPAVIIDANCTGTARLLDAARAMPRLRRIIHISSFSIYGRNCPYRCPGCGMPVPAERRQEDLDRGEYEVRCRACGAEAVLLPIDEQVPPAPTEPYAASKFMQELCYKGFASAPVNILRLSSVYGTRLRLDDGEATIIAKLAGWIRVGQPPQLFEDGRQRRDWVHVDDVVAAVMALAQGAAAPPIVNVCSGAGVPLLDACVLIAAAVNAECKPVVVGGSRPGDLRHCVGDPARLAALIGRDPRPFSEGARLAFAAPQPALRS